jgi:hypothetical protein
MKNQSKQARNHTFRFEMGVTVRDVLSGLRGTVTGRVEHMVGLDQFLVQPSPKGQQPQPAQWVDDPRLVAVRGKRVRLAVVVRLAPAGDSAKR